MADDEKVKTAVEILVDIGKAAKKVTDKVAKEPKRQPRKPAKIAKKKAEVEKAIQQAFDNISGLLDDLGDLLDMDEGRIHEFFDEVGDGMVEAQEGLDSRSADYNLKRTRGQLANMFRIPKVHAEIKFGLTKKTGRGFNILLAKKRDESTETFQNSVAFDIISVPPPPEYLEEIPLDVALVTRIADRIFIKEVMKKEETKLAKLAERDAALDRNKKDWKALGDMLKAFDETLIFTHRDEKWLFLSYQTVDKKDSVDQKVKKEEVFDFIIYDREAGTFEIYTTQDKSAGGTKRPGDAINFLRTVAESQGEELKSRRSKLAAADA